MRKEALLPSVSPSSDSKADVCFFLVAAFALNSHDRYDHRSGPGNDDRCANRKETVTFTTNSRQWFRSISPRNNHNNCVYTFCLVHVNHWIVSRSCTKMSFVTDFLRESSASNFALPFRSYSVSGRVKVTPSNKDSWVFLAMINQWSCAARSHIHSSSVNFLRVFAFSMKSYKTDSWNWFWHLKAPKNQELWNSSRRGPRPQSATSSRLFQKLRVALAPVKVGVSFFPMAFMRSWWLSKQPSISVAKNSSSSSFSRKRASTEQPGRCRSVEEFRASIANHECQDVSLDNVHVLLQHSAIQKVVFSNLKSKQKSIDWCKIIHQHQRQCRLNNFQTQRSHFNSLQLYLFSVAPRPRPRTRTHYITTPTTTTIGWRFVTESS